jgi:hypothetical protein
MSVGELANVRHPYASRRAGDPNYSDFRVDSGVIDEAAMIKNSQNFIAAVAPLVAMGDWVTVRSHVFTVYGVFRGEEDPSITDNSALARSQKRSVDVNSRAIRFQETIDRLPTFLGEPLPARIGGRTVARYLDTRND